jgi:hypothetical protein
MAPAKARLSHCAPHESTNDRCAGRRLAEPNLLPSRRDLGRRDSGGGDLIKQRLKEMIIPSVDDGHVDGGAGTRPGGT